MRLRETLQGVGGSLVRLGQQMSVRADLLPYEYCEELQSLQDDVAPMVWTIAERVLVRELEGPIERHFAEFDVVPVGSASIACVYRAVRHDGRGVAVKVRRPEAAVSIAADLAVLRTLLRFTEFLGLIRESFGLALIEQLETVLADELDLRLEARNQELFRRSRRKTRVKYLDAPAVHHDLTTSEMLVSEFVEGGVPARELLTAVDEGDTEALARFAAMDIDIDKVAMRLLTGWNWQVFDFTVFHGDPHPSNLFVMPGSRLMLVDFGACGSFPKRSRRILREIQYHLLAYDPREMARSAMRLLETFPPSTSTASRKTSKTCTRATTRPARASTASGGSGRPRRSGSTSSGSPAGTRSPSAWTRCGCSVRRC
ncbi:MAG: AarF/ABC1/UbiB kinase family protein [Proteobacteria bacterium]|nr:AarF/ABC1/UbiB kinase family protein [Pseudomonadota bacterium]